MMPEQGSCAETLGHVLVVECVWGAACFTTASSEAACRLARQERVSKADISSADPRWTLREKAAAAAAARSGAARLPSPRRRPYEQVADRPLEAARRLRQLAAERWSCKCLVTDFMNRVNDSGEIGVSCL